VEDLIRTDGMRLGASDGDKGPTYSSVHKRLLDGKEPQDRAIMNLRNQLGAKLNQNQNAQVAQRSQASELQPSEFQPSEFQPSEFASGVPASGVPILERDAESENDLRLFLTKFREHLDGFEGVSKF
jgi:hypothetical protein